MMNLAPLRGTRDFFPDDMRLRNWLFAHFRDAARKFAFEEYDAPILELEELYIRKAGEEITGQLYNFEDKGGRRVTLRPEMTPSLARLILQKGGALTLPAKWFSIPQCWRYERTTRGRRREHYQWNVDIFGVPGVTAEAELLAVLVTFFRQLGLGPQDLEIRISNRKLLQSVLDSLGVPDEKFAPVCVLVDKLEKLPREAIEQDMQALGLTDTIVDRIIETLSLKSLDELDNVLSEKYEVIDELRGLFRLGEQYGIADWLSFDASIVRGLAYYTGTVFEAFDRGVNLRAICGGGRYDRLLSTFGGNDIPACGFGFGDVVIVELLKEKNRLPEFTPEIDDLVCPFSEDLRGPAMQIASRLREQGRVVDLVLEDKKIKWIFKHADRNGASRVILIAPDEWSRGEVRVKNLKTGEESNLSPDAL